MASLAEEYQQLPPIVKFLIGLTAVGLTAFYLYTETIEPREFDLKDKQQSLTELENQLKQISSTIINPITMEEELARANREHKKILEQLPTEPSVEKILNEFAAISRLTGTEIQEFIPTPDQNNSQTTVQSNPESQSNTGDETSSSEIALKMSGTFTAIVSFLDMAMTIPRVIRMDDFEFKNTEKELKLVQRPKLEFNGKFLAYYQKNKPAKSPELAELAESSENKTEEIAKGAVDLNGLINKSFSAK